MGQKGTVVLSVEHDAPVQAIVFSPDGSRFASGGASPLVRVRVVGTGPPLDLPGAGGAAGMAFSPSGAALAVADQEQIVVYDATAGTVMWQGPVEPGSWVNEVVFSRDGRTLIGATDHLVAVLDAATGKPGRRLHVDETIAGIDLSTDGGRIALAIDERHGGNHRNAGSARVHDLASGAEVGRLTPRNAVFAVAFSPDGTTVLCCSADGKAYLFESVGGKVRWPVDEGTDDSGEPVTAPHCLAFDPTGTWTVVGGADGCARVLDAETGPSTTVP